jgi:hypothetical protein
MSYLFWRKTMNTRTTTHTIAVISVLTIAALNAANLKADSIDGMGALIYNNRAYVQDIGYAPNPVAAKKVENAETVYVDTAYGPAIYSYPSNTNNQVTAFNVEYVDTAYSPAIYSYPNNTPKHHLDLVENAVKTGSGDIVPVVLKLDNIPIRAAGTVH